MKQFSCGHFRELPLVDPIEGEMKGGRPTDYMFFSGRGASPLLVSEPLAKEPVE